MRSAYQNDVCGQRSAELVDVSRIQSGKLQLTMARFSLDELIFGTVENFAGTGGRQITVCGRVGGVVADKGYITQVLSNLITNALRFPPPMRLFTFLSREKEQARRFPLKIWGGGFHRAT